MRLELKDESLNVKLENNRDFMINLPRIKLLEFSKYNPKDKVWIIPNLFFTEFLQNFKSTDISNFEEFNVNFQLLKERERSEWEDMMKIISTSLPPLPLNFPLRQYQVEAVNFLIRKKRALLNLDLGTGKTISALVASWLLKEKDDDKTLIVTPSSLKYQWEAEIKKWFSNNPKTVVIDGSKTKRKEQYLDNAIFTITSYELLRGSDFDIIKNIPWRTVICDEATKFKNRKSLIFKTLIMLGAPNKFALTGSPVENNIGEIWSIFNWVTPSILGYWKDFKMKYLITKMINWGNKWWEEVLGTKNLDDLKSRIKPHTFRKTKKEVLPELPDIVETCYFCMMTPEQLKAYKDAVDFFEYKIQQGDWGVALQQLTCLRQIALDPRLVNIEAMGSKIGEVKDILDDIGFGNTGENIIVFSFFLKSLELLKNDLEGKGYKVIMVSGADDSKAKQDKIDFFNSNKNIVLLSSETLQYGVNLQKNCHILINLELPWNPIKYMNRVGRVNRLGQSSNVVVINLITKNSVEEYVYKILKTKEKLIDKLIGLDSNRKEILADKDFVNFLLKGDTNTS